MLKDLALLCLFARGSCGTLGGVNTQAAAPTAPERGKLIVFEGIDGTGKSTHIRLLSQYLEERGISVCTSFEPTRGEWGMRVRQAALAGSRLPVHEEIRCLLRDRREHVEQLIAPALAAGRWVLLDRYYLSMMAYQGATGADMQQIRAWNEEFAPLPDLAFWLDIPVELSMQRIQARGQGSDAFEKRSFQAEVARLYSTMRFPWLRRIDASGAPETTQAAIRSAVRLTLAV